MRWIQYGALTAGFLAAVLAVILAAPAPAAANSGVASGDTIAVTGRISSREEALYLIDTEQMTMSVYLMSLNVPSGLVWAATRSIRYDIRLRTPYNLGNQETTPQEVQLEVEKNKRLEALRLRQPGTPNPDGEEPAADAKKAARAGPTPAGLVAITAQYRDNEDVLYLINTERRTICAYQFNRSDRKLNFLSARHYEWDRQLTEYNCKGWSPERVKNMVLREEFEQRLQERQREINGAGRLAPPDEPAPGRVQPLEPARLEPEPEAETENPAPAGEPETDETG